MGVYLTSVHTYNTDDGSEDELPSGRVKRGVRLDQSSAMNELSV